MWWGEGSTSTKLFCEPSTPARSCALVAVVPNEPLRSAGRAHPLLFAPGDCSHFCQPGPQNALAVALVAIIAEYGSADEFERRVTRSAFWQERWKRAP